MELYKFGANDERRAVIVSGIHGDEFTSLYAAKKLIEFFEKNEPTHNVTILTHVNHEGVLRRRRGNPADAKDINRCFPGNPRGTSSERIAHEVLSICESADFVLDLHSSCFFRDSTTFGFCEFIKRAKCRELALDSGLPFICNSSGKPGMLATELNKIGVPTLIIESGGLGKVVLSGVERMKQSILALLFRRGFLEVPFGEIPGAPIFFKKYTKKKAPEGFFFPKVTPGQWVMKGELLGLVETDEGTQEIKADKESVVLTVATPSFTSTKSYILGLGQDVVSFRKG